MNEREERRKEGEWGRRERMELWTNYLITMTTSKRLINLRHKRGGGWRE